MAIDKVIDKYLNESNEKLRNCPECKHWAFDRQKHWCKKNYERLTYTTSTLPRPLKDKCKDFEPMKRK